MLPNELSNLNVGLLQFWSTKEFNRKAFMMLLKLRKNTHSKPEPIQSIHQPNHDAVFINISA